MKLITEDKKSENGGNRRPRASLAASKSPIDGAANLISGKKMKGWRGGMTPVGEGFGRGRSGRRVGVF